MKVYCKVLSKIRNNKAKLKKVVGIVTVAVGLRYGKINSIPTSLSSNSTQQVERLHSYVEENIQVINTNSKVIKTGSGILISNQQISEGSKSALEVRCGDFRKSGPGARAKADARRNAKAGKYSSGSTIIPGTDALLPQNTYCRYHQNAPLSCKPRVKLADGPFQGDGDNNQSPPENGNFDASKYKGGPSPFEEYEYKDPAVVAQNIGFNQPNLQD